MKLSLFYRAKRADPVYLLIIFSIFFSACHSQNNGKREGTKDLNSFTNIDSKLTHFSSFQDNPVFTGTGTHSWDRQIRERGYILVEEGLYHMWYTGYNLDSSDMMFLGYATSPDGIRWSRYPHNPIYISNWVEDMCVVKHGTTYFMFAEGRNDVAHYLTSNDRIHWEDQGDLDIRNLDGSPLSPGPYGTPTVWIEHDLWYLFYERNDQGIWLATSKDWNTWINVQDEPILSMGPETYDKYGLAVNQIIKHDGLYYAYYHGTAFEDWSEWTTNLAISKDLIHWQKFSGNPILEENKSSGILVWDGSQYKMYTMHNSVKLHFSSDNR